MTDHNIEDCGPRERNRGGPTAGAAARPKPPWQDQLLYHDDGRLRTCLANAVIVFRNHPQCAGRFAFDQFAQRSVLRGRAPWMDDPADRALEPVDDICAADWLQRKSLMVTPYVAAQALELVARESLFHPVREYLERLNWDGQLRVDRWLCTYLGAPDTPYVRGVGRRWLISGVARIYEPGCKADSMLILEGPQGIHKSKSLEILFAPWFADELPDLRTKDASFAIAGRWGFELAELEGLERVDVARIKSFLSRTVDRFRPPYGRRIVELPRQCVFAGTANGDTYLRDETGGRRFWPVRCGRIDVDALAAARDQLWAEARGLYLDREPWWFDDADLVGAATTEQAARYRPDPWDPIIAEHLKGKASVSITEILRDVLGLKVDEWGQMDQNRVARSLLRLDWSRYQDRDGIEREWRYRAPDGPQGRGSAGDTGDVASAE